MNKANECTCPSGDGSLVHPCPAHPAEQAGGDERAAFELFVRKHCGMPEHIAVNWDAKFTNDAWEGWQARAALAQPSPAGEYGDAYQGAREDIAIWKRRALEAEQALRQAHNGQTFMGEPLVQPYEAPREKVNALFKVLGFSGTASVGDILDAALERLQAQPSPAQAEQAEAERPEGPTEDELEAAGLGYPLHKEEAVKLWYSGFRSEVITVLEAWEAIGHDIGMNPDKGELLDSLRYMLEKCEAHDAALARVAELERQQPVAWMHDQPNRVDVIHRDVKDLLQRVPGSSRGIHRPLDVSEHYTIPLYAAPVAQAQHSVPEVSGIGRDFAYPRSVVLYLRTEPTDDDLRAIHDGLRSLAAAPGKEVPQAWLDVQAERRRQITAEGWTPDHDDLYCAAELPRAAAAYILSGANDEAPAIWPFSAKWWKPRDARANYMRAGALILAEIERLDRAAAAGKEVGHE
ncbi:hypothetical protein [Pseudomonas aeruginosa]|uniref:hypothetical protein n=1 Tax=Pseudomonas aeruginosa TaxID=287 RepID=UPI000A356571|nr:hypothetical protein [Pseudomonas aeruginosa]OTH16796.1 hypothetical protein CAY92_21590 [Pseudomonas aeruginosa]OTH23162.1 hypothetical protein CAY87_26285 [Pseudomonas aeruginosa]OTH36682.1 hypothetical protein CAY99_23425 [Pseudomonas aeruginosa]OTH57944.1 hypothetical protein CAY88_18915 [Pseudomonas aeruginosa]